MNNHHKIQYFLFLLVGLAFGATSCSTSSDEASESIRSSTDYLTAELSFSRLLLLARHVSPTSAGLDSIAQFTCATVDSISGDTSDFPNNGPITVHLSFPDTGCVDIDNRRKSGPISILYHDDLSNIGAVAQITFNTFGGGAYRIRGVANIAHTTTATFEVNYVSCEMFSSSWIMPYFGTSVFTQTAGDLTTDPHDDEYTYETTIEGTDSEGRDLIVSTTIPVLMQTSCAWNVEGRLAMEPSERNTRFISYGNGDCNNKTTITADGQDINLYLP